jgi:hypothetical protein
MSKFAHEYVRANSLILAERDFYATLFREKEKVIEHFFAVRFADKVPISINLGQFWNVAQVVFEEIIEKTGDTKKIQNLLKLFAQYPEIYTTKVQYEFASVLKDYGYDFTEAPTVATEIINSDYNDTYIKDQSEIMGVSEEYSSTN